jgi:hypothetical protein
MNADSRVHSRRGEVVLQTVGVNDLADSFGVNVADLPQECVRLLSESDFTYASPTKSERDKIILDVLRRIESDTQVIGAPERRDSWEKGWKENLDQFEQGGYNLDALVPRFIRPGLPIRFKGDYILPTNRMFELVYLRIFRIWLFRTYFSDLKSIYEFGCGTGFNLVELARMFPEKEYFGFDFVPASARLIDSIGKSQGWKFHGGIYDFRNPDTSLRIGKDSGIFTFGALEQVADDYKKFVDNILTQEMDICINIEPTLEMYDKDCLFDHLAMRFHTKRGYTSTYLTYLRELESAGKIRIIKVKRLFFGSMMMEGYTYIVWQPLR